ncbi:FAD-binding and (Fe-S)-binding domain-containing protein [Ningiella sp. W23]|uniref:D-2-hydroxyglutarate dehydrogenase YdiJ n=1 Tax=Ningiella sp. W23 TaxID=3023715 RepID=UPI0037583A66
MSALPVLTPSDTLDKHTQAYLDALKATSFAGDIEIGYASRMAVATDNSIYQVLPQAVVFPKSVDDLALIARTSNAFESVTFSARGGGTGTNGQSLTPGIVIDTSRHMRKILELNTDEGWVKVQCGVIKDALNDYLRPHGYFFSPDLSTSNRATIGGMINTDASGQGSLVYGKTSDHVLGLTSVLADGEVLRTRPISTEAAKNIVRDGNSRYARILQQVLETCVGKRKAILDKFPRLNRFLTGYDLEHAFDEPQGLVDVSRLLAGSEGSLAYIAEAKLSITKIPTHTALVNVKYNNFESALRHAPSMIAANATSVETVDSRVLDLARSDIIWHSVSDLIKDVPNTVMDGLNMVEYNSDDLDDIESKIRMLSERLDNEIASGSSGVIGYQITYDKNDIKKIYAMRKKAVGLLGKTKGNKKPIAFAEDTAVPPEKLADFIMEFRALLDSYDLQYGMFGHVDAGVLHVRPALDLYDVEQEKLVKTISDQVVALVAKYGGLMWGEHGKGYRSEYAPEFFGEALFDEICKIKAAFDPANKMNPGKICMPYQSGAELVSVDAVKRASFDRQIPVSFRESFAPAMSCNGNGLCFNYDTSSPMCPSSKITRDRRHSPKGRAGLIREWLFQLQRHGVETEALSYKSFDKQAGLFQSLVNVFQAKEKNNDHATSTDFSHEVFDAMNGCLACKSCTNQCPINVDVPDFRAKFLAIYHTKYARPLKDYFVANVEKLAPMLAKVPRAANFCLNNSLTKYVLKNWIGYVDAPLLSYPPLSARPSAIKSAYDFDALTKLSDEEKSKTVLVVQDPFTSFYDAEAVEHSLALIRSLGYQPVLLPFSPNGKPQHVKGFLDKFEHTARSTAAFLNKLHSLGITMLGVDASLVLCYRDEYDKILKAERGHFKVDTFTEWLAGLPKSVYPDSVLSDDTYYLFAHCTEKTALPQSEKVWQQVFKNFGLKLEIVPVGCCGMAGTYGHETQHLANSIGIFDLSWRERIEKLNGDYVLASGYSCRSQVKRLANFRPKHPVEALVKIAQ